MPLVLVILVQPTALSPVKMAKILKYHPLPTECVRGSSIAAEAALSPQRMSWPAAYEELDWAGKISTSKALAVWLNKVDDAQMKNCITSKPAG